MRRILLLAACLFLIGCARSISDIKNEDMVGEKVTVVGIVKNSVKIGSLSGFTIEDETGSIGVRTDELPKEGDKVTVSGIIIKDNIFGYYIQAKD
jgi:hypothetical protein